MLGKGSLFLYLNTDWQMRENQELWKDKAWG